MWKAIRPVPGSVWAFLNGFFLALGLTFFVQSKFIDAEIRYVVRSVTTADMSAEQKAMALLQETHALVAFGSRHANGTPVGLIQRLPLRTFDEAVLLPSAGCGDAAAILFRLLDEVGIPVRIAQMRCGDLEGCHIFVEGLIDGRWIVLDPLYGLPFRDRNGRLATFREVSADWPFFRSQVPGDYPQQFDYDGVRYTNWEKVPVLMPMLRRVLVLVLGEERTSGISLRSFFMYPNQLYGSVCLLGLVLVNCLGLVLRYRRPRAG